MRVLLVEPNAARGKSLADGLRRNGLHVNWTSEPESSYSLSRSAAYAGVVLNLYALREGALPAISRLRQVNSQIAIVVSGAEIDVADRVAVLNAGADDYLPIGTDAEELAAKLRALIRRIKLHPYGPVNVSGVQLDPLRHSVTENGKEVPLTASEYQLVAVLMAQLGQYVSRSTLEQQLYGGTTQVVSNSVEVHIHNLRRKLGGSFIKNVRGAGYFIDRSA